MVNAAEKAERLLRLLPAIYRLRDSEISGTPLHGLLSIIEQHFAMVEDDIDQLYDDWFIETCAEWVIPYIGDLLGVRGLHPASESTVSMRARVANTIAYRRRKGTATMLEQLAQDSTDWSARAVEFFELLATTQYLNHLRPLNIRTPDLRDGNSLELLQTPFNTIPHTVDVRRISTGRGRFNIPNIGIYVWPISGYRVVQGEARLIDDTAGLAKGKYYTFNPCGKSSPLYHHAQRELQVSHIAEEANIDLPLRRRVLDAELTALAEDPTRDLNYFGGNFGLSFQLGTTEIPPSEIKVCDLSTVKTPASPHKLAVDPKLGRVCLTADSTEPLLVSYNYGFAGDIGAGTFDRSGFVKKWDKNSGAKYVGVSKQWTSAGTEMYTSLREAIKDWNDDKLGLNTTICVMDSRSYDETADGPLVIKLPLMSNLTIIAAYSNKTIKDIAGNDQVVAEAGIDVTQGLMPHVRGDIEVQGITGAASSSVTGQLTLSGLLLEGELHVKTEGVNSILLQHCTIIPREFGLKTESGDVSLAVTIDHCIITGKLHAPTGLSSLTICSSIIQSDGGQAIFAPNTELNIIHATISGKTNGKMLNASESIFMGNVMIERRQSGCVRFSFVPLESKTPARYRCQPDLELTKQEESASTNAINTGRVRTDAERLALIAQLRTCYRPTIATTEYGQPSFAYLTFPTPVGILSGAENGSEMGAFYETSAALRLANLRESLDEYLNIRMEAGVLLELP